jgi:exoribonuclease R
VRYAIADVAAFVRPGGAIDAEAHGRGLTLYSPDTRTPLHPPVLSESAMSLLPSVERRAVLWTLDLDSDGELVATDVRRAKVRSVAQRAYDEAQRDLDAGRADEQLMLLREVGQLRQERERARGGVDLPTPDQEVEEDRGGFRLVYRELALLENWNAQLSLLTGMAAARLMLDGGIGVLRTMPPPHPDDLAHVQRTAAALGISWPTGQAYADVVRGLDPSNSNHAAFLNLVTMLMRGAGYTAFGVEGIDATPSPDTHSAVAAPYAHVTAPIRRLVDRYATETCLALHAGTPVPEWVSAALPTIPAEMRSADRRARELEKACVDLVEAVVMEDRVGQSFRAVVVDVRGGTPVVQLADPAVRGKAPGCTAVLGADVKVRLLEADVVRHRVVFEIVAPRTPESSPES